MQRRRFVQLTAGFAATALALPRSFARAKEPVVIVGAGILGASIAYHLSRRGAQVTVLEKTAPAAGATGKSFAWINANYSKQPRPYHLLNRLGVHAFRRLSDDLGGDLSAQWHGTLEWYPASPAAEEMRAGVRQQQEWGYPVRFIEPGDFAALAPRVAPGSFAAAAFSEIEGSVDAGRAARFLLDRARAAGAKFICPCEVRSVKSQSASGIVLETSEGEIPAGFVVLAAGVGTPRVASAAGVRVPLAQNPGLVVRTSPQPPLISPVFNTADSHFRQQADGVLVLGDDYGPPHSSVHEQLAAEPQDFPDPSFASLHGNRIRAQAARYLPAVARASIEKVSICWRPYPQDGFPIVGFAPAAPRLYIAVTHSGVTLGPLLGELAALELLDSVQTDLLEPFRPARFQDR